jgi:uncharacterized protein YecT (DUF1311 family)
VDDLDMSSGEALMLGSRKTLLLFLAMAVSPTIGATDPFCNRCVDPPLPGRPLSHATAIATSDFEIVDATWYSRSIATLEDCPTQNDRDRAQCWRQSAQTGERVLQELLEMKRAVTNSVSQRRLFDTAQSSWQSFADAHCNLQVSRRPADWFKSEARDRCRVAMTKARVAALEVH